MSNFFGIEHGNKSDFHHRYSALTREGGDLKRSKSGKSLLQWQKGPSGKLQLNYNLQPEAEQTHLDELIEFEEKQ